MQERFTSKEIQFFYKANSVHGSQILLTYGLAAPYMRADIATLLDLPSQQHTGLARQHIHSARHNAGRAGILSK